MLLESFNKQHLLNITSVLGATGEKNLSAFRGDLVLKEGSLRAGSATDRKPPERVLHQAAIVADSEKLVFVSGLFAELQDAPVFAEKYRTSLKPDTVALFFVENIADPVQVPMEQVMFKFLPYKGGMVWNETLDLLYIEKADLKGQSAEDKVLTVYEAAKRFNIKSAPVGYQEALKQTITVKKEALAGPV